MIPTLKLSKIQKFRQILIKNKNKIFGELFFFTANIVYSIEYSPFGCKDKIILNDVYRYHQLQKFSFQRKIDSFCNW